MAQISVNAEMSNLGELCEAAEIRQHQRVLAQEVTENGLQNEIVKYHREYRSTFTHKKQLHRIAKDPEKTIEENPRRRSGRDSTGSSSVILPSHCIFCKKDKYRSKSKTREKLQSCSEFRADDTVKNSALLHVKSCLDMTDIAEEVLALCSKDLISSEAKYHASCYKSFVRICYDGTESGTPKSIDNPSDPLFEAVEEFCRELIRSPRVVEFKTIRKVMSDEAEKLGAELSSSSCKNLLRKISTRFKELNFFHQLHNNVLVYPNSLKVEDLILQNSKMKSELETMNHSMGDDTASVIKVAKILHDTILAHPEQMSWPP